MEFQYIIGKTEAIFAEFSCNPLVLPEQFSKIERPEQDGVLTIENHFFQVGHCGQLRIAHTFAPKINIVAVFFFPEYNQQLPVYSMEFVMLGQKPIIALMDAACLIPMPISTIVKDFMDSAHLAYPEFSQGEELPRWFDDCRSGQDFFIRPYDKSEFLTLAEIHLSLITNLVELFEDAERLNKEQADLHQKNLENYKHHHKINSPGIRLMNRSFGEQWTEKYLSCYLFG